MTKYKVGDRVRCKIDGDIGSVVNTPDGESSKFAWAVWDSNNECLSFNPHNTDDFEIVTVSQNISEMQAVELLLSLDYTLKKGV